MYTYVNIYIYIYMCTMGARAISVPVLVQFPHQGIERAVAAEVR